MNQVDKMLRLSCACSTVCVHISLINMLIMNRSFYIASFTHVVKQTYAKEAAHGLNVVLLSKYEKTMNILFKLFDYSHAVWKITPMEYTKKTAKWVGDV